MILVNLCLAALLWAGVVAGQGGLSAPSSIPTTSATTSTNFAALMSTDRKPLYTAPTAGGAFRSATSTARYVTVTNSSGVIIVPASSTPSSNNSHSDNKTLAIVLPTTLLLACGILIGLFVLRSRNRRIAARRRANSWAARMPWVSDQKNIDGPDDIEGARDSKPFTSNTPLAPLPPALQR